MLNITDVTHVYPNGVEALQRLSLRVVRSEITAVVGRSGCGKSTLLRIAAGLQSPQRGSITLNDAPVHGPTSDVSLMFQDAALLPWCTVRANIALPLDLQHRRDTGEVDYMIDLVGLREFAHALPSQISGGMAQRVALARALVLNPRLLLLDEPFGALDAFTRESLTQSVFDICRDAGATVMLVTHSIAEAVFLADRVVVLTPRPGRVAAEIAVGLPLRRTWDLQRSPEFAAIVGEVRDAMK
ncbi:MAG: ABC transporter ATP-binding protein [Chloroflexi bacterium]|nr:ABC transporter ATP-binding protein [Chloroflexota bacterium]